MSSISKFLRILRVERGENAKDMADKLKISPSYLSAIENSKRAIPTSVQEDLISIYELSGAKQAEFKLAVEESSSVLKVDFSLFEDEVKKAKIKKIIFTLAKENVSDKKINDIFSIITK